VIRSAGPPPRRPAHRRLVGVIGLVAGLVAVLGLGVLAGVLVYQQRHADAAAARNQRFVDTAQQTLVNMFSYSQDTIEESVQRFVNGTSGPLHDMMSQPGNVENLEALFRDTNASSETVINGAALEGIDEVRDNASVLVAARVTVTDVDGVNMPSQPYRLRVIVHEDGAGAMTAYDLKYPNGGN
jgi:Mce-associated membrane protein